VIGDSLTFGDRWGYPPIGTEYVSYIKEMIEANYPKYSGRFSTAVSAAIP